MCTLSMIATRFNANFIVFSINDEKKNYVGTSKVYFIILLAVEHRIIIGLIIVHKKRIEHYHVFS